MPIVFFFNDLSTTNTYTLSLHDALPISHDDRDLHAEGRHVAHLVGDPIEHERVDSVALAPGIDPLVLRSEEHTSELQSRENLVCRLLLEKKKKVKERRSEVHIYINEQQI